MANQYTSKSRTDAPLTREEFFGPPQRQNGSYQYRVRTEGSLAAQPEPVYVPRKKRRPPENGERRRQTSSGQGRAVRQDARTQNERRPSREQGELRTARRSESTRRSEEDRRREIARRRRELERRRQRELQEQAAFQAEEERNAAAIINERRAKETEEERRLHIEQERQKRLAEREMKQKKEKTDQQAVSRTPVGSKFGFLLSVAIIMLGCMMIVLSYVRIYNKNSEIASLKRELNAVQETNKVAQQKQAETMNMNELYTYAVDTLGMVDADMTTTITVTVVNQSYTTSSLPVSDIGESKVRYHWWFK